MSAPWMAPANAPVTSMQPPPPSDYRVPPEDVMTAFGYWRKRLLWSTYLGYAVFYLLRKNLSIALPVMQHALGIDKTTFGTFFTLHDLSYGFSKFVAGLSADRYNPRILLFGGLMLSAVVNLLFGFGAGVATLGILWVLNGWCQGFGFPPCARVLAYWFHPRERGVFWGLFNTSHQVGTIAISLLAAYLAHHHGWQWAFWIPAGIGVLTAFFLWNRVRDTPDSLGLPSVETYYEMKTGEGDASALQEPGPIGAARPEGEAGIGAISTAGETTAEVVSRYVWRNPALWLVCIGNFFVYVVRTSFLNWAPTYLYEVKHVSLQMAGGLTAIYELAGLFGCLLSGWVTDRYFRGRRAPACVACMLLCTMFVFLFWKSTSQNPLVYGLFLGGVGFCVYGPQFLVGVMVADLATKRAAGTAVGLSGLFGYLSGILSGGVLGYIVHHHGWDGGFAMIVAGSVLAAIPFMLTWNAAPVIEKVE
jgi:phosphoglycerate transporter family protein